MLNKFSLGNVLYSKTQIANKENNSLYIQVTENISLLQKVAKKHLRLDLPLKLVICTIILFIALNLKNNEYEVDQRKICVL